MIENSTIEVDLEFLDKSFKLQVPKDIDIEEMFEIIEKFIFESPEMGSIDLKSLAKTILDTEYYNLILKQNKNGIDTTIGNFKEIQIGIPLKLELESDAEKKRYYTKKHLKSTFRHIESISIDEFVKIFNISNISLFRQNLLSLESKYPITIEKDTIILTQPFKKEELRNFTNQLLDFMS